MHEGQLDGPSLVAPAPVMFLASPQVALASLALSAVAASATQSLSLKVAGAFVVVEGEVCVPVFGPVRRSFP